MKLSVHHHVTLTLFGKEIMTVSFSVNVHFSFVSLLCFQHFYDSLSQALLSVDLYSCENIQNNNEKTFACKV